MTFTDIFCSAQTVLSSTGKVLVVGGDFSVNKQRGYSNAQVEIFDPDTNDLKTNSAMAYARWYPTAIGLPNGEVAILGGRLAPNTEPAIVPEVYNPMTGWRTLPGAASADAFGSPNYQLWYYPRAFLTLAGDLFVYAYNGKTFSLTTEGSGSITQLALKGIPGSSAHPDVPYASGLVLSVRANRKVQVIGMRTSPPTITTVADIDQVRYWSSGTALPDGTVAVTGGSSGYNTLDGVAYNATLWNSSTGKWTTGAAAAKARLYHSIALLLPDATVLTGGGGAPGPVNQLNAEIYYPPYLFKTDGSGEPAARPTIVSAPTTVRVGQKFTVAVGSGQTINKVTMMKLGSDTHSLDPDQRIPYTVFTQSGDSVSVSPSINKNNTLPGYYMLFVLQNNVPSIASFVRVTL